MNVPLIRALDRRLGIPVCAAVSAALRLSRARPRASAPRKILLMKWVGFGNIILASPAIAALRARFPDAEITFVTLGANKGLLERYPMVDRVYYFNVASMRHVARETWRLFRFLRRERFDLLVDLEQFSRYSAIMAGLSGARERVGFDTPRQHRAGVYTHPVPYRDGEHMAEVFCDLARALGAEPSADALIPASLTPDDLKHAEAFLAEEGLLDRPFLVIHPGTGDNAPQRRWPAERYAELADRVIRESGMAVVFSGSPREKELVDSVRERMTAPAASTAGRLGLAGFAALLQQASMIVCSDTGPVHLAAALRVPAVAFYGPNAPWLYGPVGDTNTVIYKNLPCSPCITNLNDKSTSCPHGNCIQTISVEETYLAIQQHPARTGSERYTGAGAQRVV